MNTLYYGENQIMAIRLKELHRVPLADRPALSPLRPDREPLCEDFVENSVEMV